MRATTAHSCPASVSCRLNTVTAWSGFINRTAVLFSLGASFTGLAPSKAGRCVGDHPMARALSPKARLAAETDHENPWRLGPRKMPA